ncbi:MAG: hypothetical protein ABIW46_04515 [Acidimicrobiales bacterium]
MRASSVRTLVLVVCGAGIAGMIVTSVTGHEGAALTFGLLTAGAVACLIVATAVSQAEPTISRVSDETGAARVETMVDELVARGADETAIRALVAEVAGMRRP